MGRLCISRSKVAGRFALHWWIFGRYTALLMTASQRAWAGLPPGFLPSPLFSAPDSFQICLDIPLGQTPSLNAGGIWPDGGV